MNIPNSAVSMPNRQTKISQKYFHISNYLFAEFTHAFAIAEHTEWLHCAWPCTHTDKINREQFYSS